MKKPLHLNSILWEQHPRRPVMTRIWEVVGSKSPMPFILVEVGLN